MSNVIKINPRQVFDEIPIPDVKGFRVKAIGQVPQKGESYIFYDRHGAKWCGIDAKGELDHYPHFKGGTGDATYHKPEEIYVVLEPVPPATKAVEQIVFTPTGEVRRVKTGEWFVDPNCGPHIQQWRGLFTPESDNVYAVYTREVRTVSIEVAA